MCSFSEYIALGLPPGASHANSSNAWHPQFSKIVPVELTGWNQPSQAPIKQPTGTRGQDIKKRVFNLCESSTLFFTGCNVWRHPASIMEKFIHGGYWLATTMHYLICCEFFLAPGLGSGLFVAWEFFVMHTEHYGGQIKLWIGGH